MTRSNPLFTSLDGNTSPTDFEVGDIAIIPQRFGFAHHALIANKRGMDWQLTSDTNGSVSSLSNEDRLRHPNKSVFRINDPELRKEFMALAENTKADYKISSAASTIDFVTRRNHGRIAKQAAKQIFHVYGSGYRPNLKLFCSEFVAGTLQAAMILKSHPELKDIDKGVSFDEWYKDNKSVIKEAVKEMPKEFERVPSAFKPSDLRDSANRASDKPPSMLSRAFGAIMTILDYATLGIAYMIRNAIRDVIKDVGKDPVGEERVNSSRRVRVKAMKKGISPFAGAAAEAGQDEISDTITEASIGVDEDRMTMEQVIKEGDTVVMNPLEGMKIDDGNEIRPPQAASAPGENSRDNERGLD